MIELLAPAGDPASFHAALSAGADAVYLGAQSFGARASAGFSQEDLAGALRTAHLHGKRVYVTVNTLIKERELEALSEQLHSLEALQVDAVIVQDLGVLRYIKRELPALPVHASTQMSIHNAAGARLLQQQGVSRVVLARECSLDTIQAVADTGIQTEVFIHGALCVAVSGQCLMSSQIGGRSGNRGRCAQPCRLGYTYRGKAGAWLSPRDLNLLEYVPQLLQAGVSSLKIEGRLKRLEYVSVVTRAYRHAIDAAKAGEPNLRLAEDQRELLQVFNRGGFTRGAAFGAQDGALINPLRVSHEGEAIGSIKSTQAKGSIYLSELLLSRDLNNGDNLQIRDTSQEQEMIYSGPAVPAGQRVTIRHYKAAAPGSSVHRLVDQIQMDKAQQQMAQPMPAIPLSARLSVRQGERMALSLSDGQVSSLTLGEMPQPAQSSPMSQESTWRAISKTGGSPYVIEHFDFDSDAPLFATAAQLNALRREALEDITQQRLGAWRRDEALPRETPKAELESLPPSDPRLYARTSDPALIDPLLSAGASHVLYSPQDYEALVLPEQFKRFDGRLIFCMPPQTEDRTLRALHAQLSTLGIPVMLDNVGQLDLDWSNGYMAGGGIPAWNRESLMFLREQGIQGLILSREISRQEIEDLPQDILRLVLPVYGRGRLMLLNHCPERSYRDMDGDKRSCRLCAAGQGTIGQALVDRLGEAFPLCPIRLPEGCLNILMHNRPLHLSRKAIGNNWLLDFSVESADEALAVTRYYAALLRGQRELPPLEIPYFTGRFEEGVV